MWDEAGLLLFELAGRLFYYTECTAFCQILLVLLPRARTAVLSRMMKRGRFYISTRKETSHA